MVRIQGFQTSKSITQTSAFGAMGRRHKVYLRFYLQRKGLAMSRMRTDIPGHHNLHPGVVSHISDDTRRLNVGRSVALSGSLSCDHLVVEGRVESTDFKARRLDVIECGVFSGVAEVVDAIISGRYEGSLRVTGRLVLKPTGRIVGDVTYNAIEIETGGKVEGSMSAMPQTGTTAQAEAVPVQKQVAAVQPPVKPSPESAALSRLGANVERLFRDGEPRGMRVFRRVNGN